MAKKDELDELYDAFFITKSTEEGLYPPEYRRGHVYSYWWCKRDATTDIVYRNANGNYHRLHGPAYISRNYNYEIWYKDGLMHREDGPAFTHNKNEYYFQNGKLHRLDGPAVITKGGPKEYWIDGQKLSPKYYKLEIERRKKKGLL